MGETSRIYLYRSQKKKGFDMSVLTGVLNTTVNWAKRIFSNVVLGGEALSDS